MGIKWSGMKKLHAKIAKNVSLEAVKQVIKLNGSELQQTSMNLSPVDTGQLKRSITLEIKDGGLTAVVAPHVNYAAYVEYGTRYMSAKPYIRPSFNLQILKVKKDLQSLTKP